MDADDFFDQGGERPEVVAGRYRLPHPETGVEQSWTRATTHAELPEDSFALARWQLRQLLLGLHRRPDLLRLIESWPDEPGRDELDAVISTAHEVAGNDEQANLGTAVHGVLQRVDRAWDTAPITWPTGHADWQAWFSEVGVPEWALPHANGYVGELVRHGLTPIPTMTERRVVNLDLGCAGTIDNLYREADGAVALGDKKTGRLDYPQRKHAIQLAVYHGSAYLLDLDGGPPLDLRSIGLRREYAVLVHVDPDSGACSVYRVDIRRGQLGANLAADVRAWRRERHLLLPYVAPGALPAEQWRAAEGERHLRAVPPVPPAVPGEPPFGPGITSWSSGDATVTVSQGPGNEPGTHAVSGGLADDPVTAYTAEALMKLSKAELQGVLRGLDPGASVAHQRKILVDKILTVRAGERVASSTPTVIGPDPATGRPGIPGTRAMSLKDPAEITGPIGGEDPTDPRTPAFYRARLTEITAAESVGVLGRIHGYVTRVGGDQAWTDELTEAARVRAAELDAADHPPYRPRLEWKGREVDVLQAISEAAGSQDMAQVWNLVTVGGSDEARWTAEVNAAAHARLAAIDAAGEKPPSTPFGSTQ